MKEESKIVELLSERLFKLDVLTGHVDTGFDSFKQEVGGLKEQMGKVGNEIVKLIFLTAEHPRSLMKLADNNERITRLEKAVFE